MAASWVRGLGRDPALATRSLALSPALRYFADGSVVRKVCDRERAFGDLQVAVVWRACHMAVWVWRMCVGVAGVAGVAGLSGVAGYELGHAV